MSQTSDKIAHDKWVRKLRGNNTKVSAIRSLLLWNSFDNWEDLRLTYEFKRLQLI